MENKLSVGDYVRTKKSGYIGKIYNINEFREPNMIYVLDIPRADDYVFMGKDDFISSKDIIDLIEVGDLWEYEMDGKKYIVDATDEEELKEMKEELQFKVFNLLSILTKEQFQQKAYRIGDE